MIRSLFLCLCIPFFVVSQQKKKVLFIGNSYTYVNNLPQLLADLALSKQDTVVFDQSVFGGFTFGNHCNTPQTWQKIRSNSWDVVILQAQSQEPSFSPSQVLANTYPYAKQLNDSVKAANPCSEVMFYMTWGRKNGDASNCASYPPVCSYLGMQARLRESYMMFKDSCRATCAPVGVAWKKHVSLYPSVDLYQPDESHPSMHGSYLAACVFYSSIFKKSCVGASYPSPITSGEASNIQSIAAPTVLDSTWVWNLGSHKPKADFAYTYLGNNTYQFTNASMNSNTYNWSFGSTLQSPVHQFTVNPPHTIKLKANNACTTDSVVKTIVASGIHEGAATYSYIQLKMLEDGTYATSGIDLYGATAQIINGNGQLIRVVDLEKSNGYIDTKGIAPGVYIAVFYRNRDQLNKQKLLIR